MTTQVVSGAGTILKRGDGNNPEAFTKVPEVTVIPPVGESNPFIKVTFSDAEAEEYIAGRKDGDEIEFTMNYIGDAQQDGMIEDYKAQTNRNYQIVTTAGLTLSFTLAPGGWKFDPNHNEQNKLMFKGKISGGVSGIGD